MKLEVNNLKCGYGKRQIIRDVSFSLNNGEIVCLLGPNGAGKTTFFKTLLGFIKPMGGGILINGKPSELFPNKELARIMAYVPQACHVPFPFTVAEVVTMGRNPHMGIFASPSRKDREVALSCLEDLDISHLRDKVYTQLSGGERQMVLIARAAAQETELLIMDEPTSNLDFGNQVRILNKINKLKKRGIGVIMTTHSPDHVFLCGTKVIIFRDGKFAETGLPQSVVTEQLLRKVYGVDVLVRDMKITSREKIRVCVPCLT